MTKNMKDVEALIRLFDQSDWVEMRLEVKGLSIVLSNDPSAGARALSTSAASVAHPAPMAATASAAVAVSARSPAAAGPATTVVPDGLVAVRAPNLGTFYRSPKPGAQPYVELGQAIEPETEVCLIEVMKLFTPVKAGVRGRLVRVCVEDGCMVDYDAPLFLVEPLA